MLKNLIGTLGMSLPFLLVIGLVVFHLNINRAFEPFNLVDYNIRGLVGLSWARYFIYIFIGIVKILFSFGLLYLSKRSITNKISSILFLIIGIIWTSFGIIGREDGSDFYVFLLLARMLLSLLLIIIGFLLFCNELHKLTGSTKTKWFIYSFTLAIFLNSILEFLINSDYPVYLGILSWFLYFLGLGIIGFGILKKASGLQNLKT